MKRCTPFFLLLFFASCSDPSSEHQSKIAKIKSEIERLEQEKREEAKRALNADVESQGYMRRDYAEFAEKLEESETREDRVKEIEKEIEDLKAEKKTLEQTNP